MSKHLKNLTDSEFEDVVSQAWNATFFIEKIKTEPPARIKANTLISTHQRPRSPIFRRH